MSRNDYGVSDLQILKSLIRNGHFGLICREIRRRIYSNGYFLLLYREITLPGQIPVPKIHVTLRTMKSEDIPWLLDFNQKGMKDEDIQERIRILRILKSGLQKCYVAETDEGIPCHISWWINSSQNPMLQDFSEGGILPLAADEVLVEGAFTLEAFQRLGIQKWRRLKFFEKSLAIGAKRVINYVRCDNLPSLRSCRNAGYKLFMIRKDKWRIFRRSFIFKPVPEGTLYPLENGQIKALLQN